MSVRPALRSLGVAVLAWGMSSPVRSATALSELRVSPDTTLTLGSVTVNDENIAADNLAGSVSVLSIGSIPAETALDAYAVRPSGEQLLSFDTTVVLPGGGTARPGDVWRYDGANYSIEFDAAARGVPDAANLDALAFYAGSLLMSFDVALDLGGVHFEPEDLIRFDGTVFSMFFDGSQAGVASGLNLDGADHLPCNGHLLLSFDGSGTVGGVPFDDEDVLEFDGAATWQMSYDGTLHHPNWDAVDLSAIRATVDLGPGPPVVLGQNVTADADKSTFRWTSSVPFRQVKGSFASSTGIGAYAVAATILGNGTTFNDSTTPGAGTGIWYLVKPGGCTQTSWQSTLGSEPGRDASIP